ncbi:MAG: type II toxin-antitoxin system RelE/ParE family toxin [Actinobacteria bacterium]|nr:type II toxin-antitoxin system RelE/ParE family toxin [Actinomycetota bacterium]
MAFRVEITSSAKKLTKKFSLELKEKVITEAYKITENLYEHEKLSGPLSKFYSWHFSFKGTEYRITYQVFNNENRIVIVLVGTRENFYERLKKLFD